MGIESKVSTAVGNELRANWSGAQGRSQPLEESPDQDQVPRINFRVGRTVPAYPNNVDYRGDASERGWTSVIIGAAILSLGVAALAYGPAWFVLLGPFVLIGTSRIMGLRSLWR